MYNSSLYIHSDYLKQNIDSILSELGDSCSLIPVLKCDAYGLGVKNIAPLFEGKVGCIAVAHISEGIALRNTGFSGEILVLGSCVGKFVPDAVEAGLTLTVSRPGFASSLPRNSKVQVEINTGLNRAGLSVSEVSCAAEEIIRAGLEVSGAYSHFSCTSDLVSCETENTLFLESVRLLEESGIRVPLRHISCSASFENFPQFNLDAVRIGRRLYMDAPGVYNGRILESFTWQAYITDIRSRKEGEFLGYEHAYRLKQDADIALISVGYGDGLCREFATMQVPVLVNGKPCNVLSVYMDQAVIDVSGVRCSVGDRVTIFGYDGNGKLIPSQLQAELVDVPEGVGLSSFLSPRVERIVL